MDGVRVGLPPDPGRDTSTGHRVQVLWLGRDQFDVCAYDVAEIESILENFEIAFKGIVSAEYIIQMCTKPMSRCLSARPSLKGLMSR